MEERPIGDSVKVYSWFRRPVKEEVVEPVFETMAEQGYVKTKVMIKRFREAGERVAEQKRMGFDYE